MNRGPKKRIIIGMSGASGAILGITLLQIFREKSEYETHLVISRGAEITIQMETNLQLAEVTELADAVYDVNDVSACLASGAFLTEGMIVIPCSMKTLAGIACGYSDNLLLRAADVTIKEKRKLLVIPRECPLSVIHLRNMLTLAELGVWIMPPMLTYYTKPKEITDINRQFIDKIIEKFAKLACN